jgi:hypothetical protein
MTIIEADQVKISITRSENHQIASATVKIARKSVRAVQLK